MGYTSNILMIGLLMLCSCKNQAQPLIQTVKDPLSQIYGRWKFEEDLWKQYTKYTQEQIDSLKETVLKISETQIYFENISFINSCSYSRSKVKVTRLFDKSNIWEYSWYEDGERFLLRPKDVGPLIYRYTKEELSKMSKIELGCDNEPNLNTLYLKQDTLILNYMGGVTLFMTKEPFRKKSFAGVGKSTKELTLTGEETSLKLSYDFLTEADRLILEDGKGNELFSTDMIATDGMKNAEIFLSGVRKLFFKVKASKSSSKWKFTAELY